MIITGDLMRASTRVCATPGSPLQISEKDMHFLLYIEGSNELFGRKNNNLDWTKSTNIVSVITIIKIFVSYELTESQSH